MKALKTVNQFVSIALPFVLAVSLAAGCSGSETGTNDKEKGGGGKEAASLGGKEAAKPQFSELKIRVLGKTEYLGKPPKEDLLGPVWREKTKVIPEIVTIPTGTEIPQWLQMSIVGKTLPEVTATNGILDNPQHYDLLRKNNALREIKLEDMRKYMPLLKKRAEKYGVSLEQIYSDNVGPDGKLWYVPGGFSVNASPYLRDSKLGETVGLVPYFQYVRDDILKMAFPNAKTEAELKELYKKQGGELKYEDITDVPIYNREDFYNFLVKIKELNLKEDGKPVIPAHPSMNSDVASMMWSAFTFAGFWWEFGSHTWKGDQFFYAQGTPEWKEYIRWWNKAYNAGLLDKEHFIQKDEQKTAKVVNGEYAVFQQWLPVGDARKQAKAKGKSYGYRLIPLFLDKPLENAYQNHQYVGANLAGSFGGVAVTVSAKEENVPQILSWIDWNMSEEADEIRNWGIKGKTYTGEGAERRFTPEFKSLEDFYVRGTPNDRDGDYYGMTVFNMETNLIKSFPFPEPPYLIYPKDLSGEINVDGAVQQAIVKHYKEQVVNFKQDVHMDFKYIDPNGDWAKLSPKHAWDSEKGKTAIAKAIVKSTEDFDKNYAEYEKTFGPEWNKMNAEFAERWKGIYNQYVKPEIDKTKAAK